MPEALFATIHEEEPVTWTREEIEQLVKQSGFYNSGVISYTIKTGGLAITIGTGSSPDLASGNNNNHHHAPTTPTYIADPAKDIISLDAPRVDSLLHNQLILACQDQVACSYSSIDTYEKTHSTRPAPTYMAETDEPSTYYNGRKFYRNGRGGFRCPYHDQYTHSQQRPRSTAQRTQQCFVCKKKGMG
jgi:hypothetical protein